MVSLDEKAIRNLVYKYVKDFGMKEKEEKESVNNLCLYIKLGILKKSDIIFKDSTNICISKINGVIINENGIFSLVNSTKEGKRHGHKRRRQLRSSSNSTYKTFQQITLK